MRNRFSALALLTVVLCATTGCGAGGQSDGTKALLPRQGLVRVVNAMPDAGRMTSFLSSSVFSSNQYGEATALSATLVGQYVMNILLTPPTGVSTTLVGNDPLDLTDQDEISYFLIGPTATPRTVRVNNVDIAYGVDTRKPSTFPPPDFQILHAATDTGAADVYVTDAAVDIATVAPTATVSFGDLTPLVQQDPAVTYRVRVTPAGSKTVLFDSGSFTVARLKRSIYMLMDNFSPSGETLRVANVTALAAENFGNQTSVTSMRGANMIPDAAAIDIYLGDTTGTPLFANVPYGATTAYMPIPNGAATVNITPAGVPGTIIKTGPLTVVGGQGLSLYASGLVSDASGTYVTIVESLRSISGQAQFRFVAAAPSAGSIDVYLVTPGQPINDAAPVLANGALLATSSTALTPGSYDMFVTRSGTTIELLGPERISVDAGAVYSAVLRDVAVGGPLTVQVTQEVLP
jgi:hypothetical protein